MNFRHVKLKCAISVLVLGLLFCIFCSMDRSSSSQAANSRDKRVVSIMVEEHDTLWSIAKNYYTPECGSLNNYIKEIKQCNSLSSDVIYSGYHLIVPVWTSDQELAKLNNNENATSHNIEVTSANSGTTKSEESRNDF